MCVYNDIMNYFDTWRYDEDCIPNILSDKTMTEAEKKESLNNLPTLTRMFPLYLDAIKNPYIRQKAEQFRNRRLAQKDLATPLPSTPEAELIGQGGRGRESLATTALRERGRENR